MHYYAVTYQYRPDNPQISDHRPAHREFIAGLDAKGLILGSGPFGDSAGGALIVLSSQRPLKTKEVIALMDDDPFFVHGCLTGRTFREWNPVIGSACD